MLTSNLFLLSIGVLTLIVCIVLGAVLYFAANGARAKPEGERKIMRLRSDSLRTAFRQAVELIEGNIASRAERYNVPWIMVLNEGDERQPLPIAQSGVASALGSDAANAASTQGIAWNFFDRGVVIDIKAAWLGSPDDEGDEKPWDEFLGLCRNYRPQRPFDSVVVTVPADMLLAGDTDAQLELVRRAKLAHRRLWLAQNRFAVRFAVYVVVTGCEALPGFTAFARALPESMRSSMLGWSSPYDLSTTYQPDWIDTAMACMTGAVSDATAELFALAPGDQDARQFLMLPSRIEGLRAQLQRYVEELLRPSAYHEPFFFRGIYLTGDSNEIAQGGATVPGGAAGAVEGPGAGLVSHGEDSGALDPQTRDAVVLYGERAGHAEPGFGADGERDAAGDILDELMLQPAFLRDLFEKKIFAEYGLTRPSRSQHLSRPVVHRALRWGGIVLLGGWGIGLVVAGWQLHYRNAELVTALGELRSVGQQRAMAAQHAQELSSDWYRREALSLIAMNQRLAAETSSSVFMPGSWSMFDDLDRRVRDRFEHAFGDVAVTAIQRELLARVSQLTGVGRDPSTGQLISGDDCAAPDGMDVAQQAAGSLSVADLPDLRAMQRYVGSLDQLDATLQALQRLQRPDPRNADALRLVVRYTLGAELQGNVSGSLPFFYRNPDGGRTYAGDAAASTGVGLAILQPPLRCTFEKGMQRLDDRLFRNNALLVAERAVTDHLGNLSLANTAGGDFGQIVADYRSIVAGINAEQDLLGSGKGAWMRREQFTPGPVYERTFAQAAQNRLIGADIVAQDRERSATAFQVFRSELAQRFGGPDSGVVWLDKDGRYALSPGRVALRDGLTALLNQPFMAAPRDLALPLLPDGSMIVWDRAQLDKALTLGDMRKRFLAEGLTGLPAAAQPAIGQALDTQFARLAIDAVAAAATVTPVQGDPDSANFDAANARLVKIRAMLAEMGANARIEDLDTLVSHDALAHLRAVDTALAQSELYATRPAAMSDSVRPAHSLVLAAFGVHDVAGLAPYLAQQSARALALGHEASIYLAALDAADLATPLAQRWQAINRDLGRYQLKNPNSSLLNLEQFVQTVAAEPGAGGCMEKFAARPSASGGDDYFAQRHAQLYDKLLATCSRGYTFDLRQQWGDFSTAFNQSVAGRQPFGGAIPVRADGAASADFGELGDVLKRYQRISTTFAEARGTTGTRSNVAGVPVRQFVDNFNQVKTLLAPLYPSDSGAPTGYDVGVEFRASRDGEVAGNQVIDWTVTFGAQSVSMRDAPHPLHWDYGTPVVLTLRFAKDSPLIALNDAKQRALSTDGRTLTWQFDDPWALITAIARERVADSSLRADGASQLLRLEFPLGTASPTDAPLLPKESRGRVFLRFTLMPAGRKTPLPWPRGFPTRAPEWSAL
ncbi:MAG: type VI secretion protein IcmF [Paraburkholderia sp.]|uniref:type VI secretion system protein n=1 Tax=Paraburkholderia sp. TaxID=1926495 RepID=UPI00120E4567|nr:type VI secretion system protein [Paraburkholderia sp.]TAL97860.1 MAG: type VI secretion protein IcmF [Paraburkholderia sp.]